MVEFKRAEKILRTLIPKLSKKFAIEAIDSGLVKHINGRAIKKGTYLSGPNELDVSKLKEHLENLKKGNENLIINVIDKNPNGWLVVDKGALYPSNPNSLFDTNTITNWAFYHYPTVIDEFDTIQPTITPHRLDIGTSGVQIVALRKKAYDLWREKFSQKLVEKLYLAWCHGIPEKERFIIKKELAHHPARNSKMVICENNKYRGIPRAAELSVRILRIDYQKTVFLAEIITKTGITHQIRVCMASIGYPLVGDRLYGEIDSVSSHHLLRAKAVMSGNFHYQVDTKEFETIFN